jgi:hypothetical protein
MAQNKDEKKAPKEAKDVKTPRERWLSVAPKRMTRCLKAVENLRKLSNPKAYQWTDKELEKLIGDLGAAFETLENSFRQPGKITTKAGWTF